MSWFRYFFGGMLLLVGYLWFDALKYHKPWYMEVLPLLIAIVCCYMIWDDLQEGKTLEQIKEEKKGISK